MTTPTHRARQVVDRMLREATALDRYASRGEAAFFDLRAPELRDAIELRLLHFVESGTKVGKAFRNLNPKIPWAELDELRNELVHEYPNVRPERVWRFVRVELPKVSARLRSARFPTSPDE